MVAILNKNYHTMEIIHIENKKESNNQLTIPVVKGNICCIQLNIKEAEVILHSLTRTNCSGDNLTVSMEFEDKLFEKVIKHYR